MPDEFRKPDPFSYLPVRISKGSIQPAGLKVHIHDKTEVIPWDEIPFVCIGIVDEPVFEVPPTPYMQIKAAFEKLFSSEQEPKIQKRTRRKIYIEIFTRTSGRPFRIEAGSLDYRGFLGNVEHNSVRNLKKFLETLSLQLPASVLDASYPAYLKDEKDPALFFPNVYEFQRSCRERFRKAMEQS